MEIRCGKRVYQWQGDWAKVPAGFKLGYTHGLAEDKAGRIYVANQGEQAILVFEPDGSFVTAWGEQYSSGAHGLRHSVEGGQEFLYLSNTGQNEVVKTTLTGEVVWKVGTPPRKDIYGADKKFVPTEAAVGPNGRVYITDGYGSYYVHIYTTAGEYVSSFGGPGEAEGQLREPHGIAIDARGGQPVVQIANRANRRIDNFSLEGKFLATAIGPEHLRYPCTTILQGEDLYIPDLFCRVSVFDKSNKPIGHICDYVDGAELTRWDQFKANEFPDLAGYPNIPHEKRKAGKFSSPHGLHVDGAGNVYVVEWINDGRITRLKRMG